MAWYEIGYEVACVVSGLVCMASLVVLVLI